MPKRTNETETQYIKRKLRKLEKKLKNQLAPDPEIPSPPPESSPPPPQPAQENEEKENEGPEDHQMANNNADDLVIEDESALPEEFLLALGTEGEDNEEKGPEIRPELANRWTKLMNSGIEKENLTSIIKKYPTPSNLRAEAPKINPEISAPLSDISLKRDNRIVIGQNLMLKALCALGKTLTDVMKGNIKSSSIVEQVNDAAKICCSIIHEDSSSRKFFALAGTNTTIREAVKDSKPDELLFGKDCAKKIKAAQTIKKTGNQIKAPELPKNKNPVPKQTQPKRQGNWRGPPHQ